MASDWHFHIEYWQQVFGDEAVFVYVIRAGDIGPIKVGVAKNPEGRLREHQTSNHERLTLLHVLPGGRNLEAELHRNLKDARLHGEWFAGPEIDGFIKTVERRAEYLLTRHERYGEMPSLDLNPKPSRGHGIPSGAFIGPGLQSRWRLGDGKPHPVTIRYVDPKTLT